MEFCWIPSCKNFKRYNRSVKLYPVPEGNAERTMWAKAFGLDPERMSIHTRICAAHFIRKDALQNMILGQNLTFLSGGSVINFSMSPNINTQLQLSEGANVGQTVIPPPQIPVNKSVSINSNITVPEIFIDGVHSEIREEIPSTMRNLLMCELLLECQEENLTDAQKNFHSLEWMDYVKYNTNIRQLPHVSAVNGSEFGEHVSDSKETPELPMLIFTNASQNNQTVSTPSCITPASTPTSVASNVSLLRHISPQNIPSDLKLNISGPAAVISTPSTLPPQSVFPVKLEKVTQPPEKPLVPQTKEEEIFPLISSDCLSDTVFNKAVTDGVELSVYNEVTSGSTSSVSNSLESSGMETVDSSASEDSSGLCLSPGQLCNVEITVDETETSPLFNSPVPPVPEFPSPSTSVTSEDSNGPRIVGVLGGNAVANAFYNNDFMAVDVMDIDPPFVPKKNIPVESTPSENSMPKTVTQWSIFAMQKTIAVISSGSLDASTHNLLGIRPHIPPKSNDKDAGTSLKNRLREENFMTLAAWWLVEKRFVPFRPPCQCGGKIYKMNSHYNYADGLCWSCTKCDAVYPVRRPRFFELFPQFSLEELLLLTYHWACKSRVWFIMKDVPVKEEKIWNFFAAMQKLCGTYVSKHCHMGKNSKIPATVEVSAVKLGKFFILCAYDRKNKVTRLQALTTEEACSTLKHIKILEEWLGPFCTLITWKKIGEEFLPGINKVSADPSVTQVSSPGRHILNASKYLGKTMVQLFQNISHDQLTLEIVQGFLNEVQWRERFGRLEESAFWGILNEISRLNENHSYTEAVLGEIAKDRYFYKSDITFQLRWGPFDIGTKSSWTFNISEVSDQAKQNISKSVEVTTKKMVDSVVTLSPSTSKQYAEDIKTSKRKHPISPTPSPTATRSSAGDKIYGELITSQDLLSVKITFSSDAKYEKAMRSQAENLGDKLKKEGFLRKPVRWLVFCKFIEDEAQCYVCHAKAKLVDNPKFSDYVSWLCVKPDCMFENRFKRPSFFATFGFRLDFLFAIIYHWAVQSDYKTVMKTVPLNEFNIISVHRKIQKVCSEVIKRPNCKIGGKKFLVEVALVKFANCFILGAMERDTKLSRFRAFSIQTKLHIDAIRKTLISWLHPGSTVIVNSNKYLGQYCMEEKIHLVFADREVQDVNSDKYHTLTISNYLQNHLKTMFSSIKVHFMSAELLQIYLDELVWRERYGRSPSLAFYQIFKDIFAMEHGVAGGFNSDTSKEDIDMQYAESMGISLPLPEVRVVLERLPEHVIQSYTCPVEEVKIVESFELNKEIKQEVLSDEEIEIIKFVPNSEKSLASSSLIKENVNMQTNIKPLVKENVNMQTNIKPKVERSKPSTSSISARHEDRKRYSDKCYSHRRKVEDLLHTKFRCMECKDVVTLNHFGKWFSCADCKYITYTTCCPKAYAQHRSPILFGKKMAKTLQEFEGTLQRNILLPESWYCSCGYSSAEGNKLATHLIKCEKTTCYLKSDDSSSSIL